jgi:hypothetical protein
MMTGDQASPASPVVVKDQPALAPSPVVRSRTLTSQRAGAVYIHREASRIKRKFTTQQGWLGDYDYAWYETYMTLTFTTYFDTQSKALYSIAAFYGKKKASATVLRSGR